jgi:hypothetical protein
VRTHRFEFEGNAIWKPSDEGTGDSVIGIVVPLVSHTSRELFSDQCGLATRESIRVRGKRARLRGLDEFLSNKRIALWI